ncbi:Putative hydrogenase 2 b cytochrome subunit (fragment) [mine drainage metagenome]|uniref:Hydrogenase 2 b cytochrome subunit n=1 Tax=mine drainage metagenome TaxID=410659 RepID=A0A3P3ZRL2_9ZZZZ
MQYGVYSPLFWTFFVMKFIIPFVTLVFPFSRHNPRVIFFIACDIVLGSWVERYTWISGTYPTPHFPMTGSFDIGVTVVVVVTAFLIVRSRLRNTQVIK